MEKRRISSRIIYIAVIASVVTFLAGYAIAGLTVTNSSQSGNGNYVGAGNIPWWSDANTPAAAVKVIPSSGTSAVSVVQGTNTLLPSSATSYTVGTVTAGDIAEVLVFSELSSASLSTFFEVVFTLSTGAGPTVTTTTAYLETQATAPGGTILFTFYLDAGSASSSSVTINSVQQISQLCGSTAASCP
jgi:hypothetical protein